MGLFDKIKEKAFNEFIDIIEWLDNTNDTIIWRFPRYQSEIKNGAKLVVRETQIAVLVNEGQFADIYEPGTYELTTNNMPILSTIKGWKYGFNSPFKVDVYYVSTKQFLNLKWGTQNPIMMRDKEFGPVRLRAFGSYCFKVELDPTKFIKNVVGTDGNFTTEGIKDQLRNFVITKFTDHVAESQIQVLDLAANLNEFSEGITKALAPDFSEFGIELTKFLVENISLPPAVEEALDRRTSMGVIGAGNMNAYTQMQAADSMKIGATTGNDSPAGSAMSMGMGMAMAGQMASQMMNQQNNAQAPIANQPPPLVSNQSTYYVAINGAQHGPFNLQQLQQMITSGQFNSTSQVWKQGMPAWAIANTVPELQNLFNSATPPPIPPPLP